MQKQDCHDLKFYNMTPNERYPVQRPSMFTRGEKCIFTHVVVTFVLIIILVIIYFVHLCLISHKGDDMFKMTRRQKEPAEILVKMPNYKSLGLVFLKKPTRALCNAILVQKRWSAAPGLCVAARSEPHLSDLLPYWAIKYKTESGTFFELEIIRSITYPRFNKDDLDNNIGLFEHEDFENVLMFTFPLNPINLEDDQIANNMDIISWDLVSNSKGAIVPHNDVIMRTPIKGPMLYDDCRMYLSAISDLRGHEICVVVEKQSDVELVLGALLYANSNIIGFFSWGQRQTGELPIVILNITSFRNWLEYIIT